MTVKPTPSEQRQLNRRARLQAEREARPEPPGPVRVQGDPGDAPAWSAPPQRLTVVERDGKVSVFEPGTDGAYLAIDWYERTAEMPWVATPITSRFGLASVEKLVLEDIQEEV